MLITKQEPPLDATQPGRFLPIRSPRHDGPDYVLRLRLATPLAPATGRARLASRRASGQRIRMESCRSPPCGANRSRGCNRLSASGRTAHRVDRSAANVEGPQGESVPQRAGPCGRNNRSAASSGSTHQTETARSARRRRLPHLSGEIEECGAWVTVLAAVRLRHRIRCAPLGAVGRQAPHVAVDDGRQAAPRCAVGERTGRGVEPAALLQRLADRGDAHLRSIRANRPVVG